MAMARIQLTIDGSMIGAQVEHICQLISKTSVPLPDAEAFQDKFFAMLHDGGVELITDPARKDAPIILRPRLSDAVIAAVQDFCALQTVNGSAA